MEGVSWSASPLPEAFKRPSTTADTLNRLASFIARVECKPGLGKSCKQLPPQQLLLQEDTALPFDCHECGESFPCGAELSTHQEAHHALPKPHRCSGCGEEFSLRSSLQLHNCKVSSWTQNSLSYATSLIPNKSVVVVLDRSPYACAPCGRGFMLKQALLHHQQAGCCAKAASPSRSEDTDAEDPNTASEGESSSSNSACAPDAQSVCKSCPRTFRDEEVPGHHNKAGHSDERDTGLWESSNGDEGTGANGKKARSKKGLFCCRSCEMVFHSTAALSKHRKAKHRRGLKLSTQHALGLPAPKHKRTNTYTCQVCSQVFIHHLSLWAHSKKHPAAESGANHERPPPNDATKDCTSTEKPKTGNKLAPSKLLVRESVLTKAVSVAKKFPPKFHKSHKLPASVKPLKCAEVPKEDDSEDEAEFDEDEFPCPSCPEVFSQHSELAAHVELHQSAVNRSRCGVCDSEMDSLNWPGAKRLRPYHCLLCQTGFSALEPFLSHCQNHLRDKVEEET